jgi:GTP pyrophosphokinase
MTADFNRITQGFVVPAAHRAPAVTSPTSVKRIAPLEANVAPSLMTLKDLLAETEQYLTAQDMEKIRRAYDLANKAHGGVVRRSGEPYIQHPLEVAFLLAEMRIDADGIVSALLHDVVEDTDYSLDELRQQFGNAVANIVDGVTKFDTLALRSSKSGEGTPATAEPLSLVEKRRQRTETVRKMMLAMAEDPRVVVLKLADRLHNMRTLGVMKPSQQQNTARETNEIYVPLAGRLGMHLVQAELEDLVFSYLEPAKYQQVKLEVEEEMRQRQPYIDEVCKVLREEIQSAGISAEVHAWQKHLASINRKLEELPRQHNVGDDPGIMSQIYDFVSFRILVDSDSDCYLALGHIHALWRPKDGRIKDFIATPKQNGYQSLHTTVFCLENRLTEIQIRTHDMQRTADYGIASYWYLRERIGDDEASLQRWHLSYHEMVSWIEQLRQWQRELPQSSADEFVEAVKGDIFQEQIFVFTPKGEVKDLPRGSTPLDMAYRIHTDIGDHCIGARIITNMGDTGRLVTRIVPLDYELKGGEIVDIMVNRSAHPTRDWLSFARTAAARTKIRRYLKTYEREINLQLGRERLDLALKTAGASGLQERVEEHLEALLHDKAESGKVLDKYNTLDDVFVALGREDLHIEEVMAALQPLLPENQIQKADEQHEEEQIAEGNGHYLPITKLAECCCPIPGDAIIGLLNPGKGMFVHRSDCRTLRRYRNKPDALVQVNWLQIEASQFLTAVTIIARDRSGLLRDVAAVVADAGINMTSVASVTNTSSQRAVITATLEIAAAGGIIDQLERIVRRLRQVKNVVSVERAR